MPPSLAERDIYAFPFAPQMKTAPTSLLPKLIAAIEPEMAIIPEGEFLMGCATGAIEERPVHRARVDSFAIAVTALTNRLYRIFLEDTAREAPPGWNDDRFNHQDQPMTS